MSFVLTASACTTAPRRGVSPPSVTRPAVSAELQALKADVEYLGSATLQGRKVGSDGSIEAGQYIARQYLALDLIPLFVPCEAPRECAISATQPFIVGRVYGQNIGAKIIGSDPVLRNEYVVIGAHYDHVGVKQVPSRNLKEKRQAIYPGADDNASGTAAELELARRLAAHPPRRSIILLNFDAEEEGLVGSDFFVHHLPVPRNTMVFMVNLDMVGRLRKNELFADKSVLGLTEHRIPAVLDSVANSYAISVKYIRSIDGRSDHSSFEHILVPALALFTGFHDDYHTPDDVVSKLNVPGIGRVVDITEALVRFAADRTDLKK